jgi:hypothetical protein
MYVFSRGFASSERFPFLVAPVFEKEYTPFFLLQACPGMAEASA